MNEDTKLDFPCPFCGSEKVGSYEKLSGVALVSRGDDDKLYYEGYTEIFWNDQQSRYTEDGEKRLMCCASCGEVWPARETIEEE